MEQEVILGNWPLQGHAQVARYLLVYLDIPFTDKTYTTEEWIKARDKIGLNFPNLPYLIDGERKLTENFAIVHYIVKKANRLDLRGKTFDDQLKVQTIYSIVTELGKVLVSISTAPKQFFEQRKFIEFKKKTINMIELSKFLGNKEWMLGYLTIADFYLIYFIDWTIKLDPKILNGLENLVELHKRFFSIESIKNYVESDKYFPEFLPTTVTWAGPQKKKS